MSEPCKPLAAVDSQRPSKTRMGWTDLVQVGAELDENPERDWFAKGAIEGCPTVVLIGGEKRGKSWMALDLAVATVSGGSWLGRFDIVRPGPAVYLDFEYGPYEFARRVQRIARGRGLNPRDVLAGIHHLHAPGVAIAYQRREPGEKSTEENYVASIASDLKQVRPSLIVVDPLRNALNGSENNADDMMAFFLGVELLKRTAECPVLVLHHLNKAGGYAGSRALLGRADMVLEGSDEPSPWFTTIGRTMRRGDALTERFTCAIEHEHDDDDARARTMLSMRFAGESGRSKPQLSRTTLRVLELLRGAGTPLTARQIRDQLKLGGSTVKQALNELAAADCAECTAGKWSQATAAFFAELGAAQ